MGETTIFRLTFPPPPEIMPGHRRHGLTDGEQRVTHHPIRTEPEFSLTELSAQWQGPDAGSMSAKDAGTVQTRYRVPSGWGN